jgi:hypothetical protein
MNATRCLRLALLGAAAALGLSCGDSTVGVTSRPPARPGDLFGLPIDPSVSLLHCAPLAADSVTQMIGPAGGVIQVGPHALTIPPGALADSVAITAVAPSDTVNRVRFQPEGLTFAQPASLTMSYANCDVVGSWLPKQIAYTTAALAILELLPSLDDMWGRTVTANVGHFSDYAIAW